jgi:hypothetical protein
MHFYVFIMTHVLDISAAPFIAGAAAIVRQYFVDGWYETGKPDVTKGFQPRASLVKAVLLNSAEALLGIQDDQTKQLSSSFEYDMNQGYGRVNLLKSLPIEGQNVLTGIFVNAKRISTGQEDVYDVKVSVNSGCNAPLSIGLTWTDPPVGPMCGDCKNTGMPIVNLIFLFFSNLSVFCPRRFK